MAENSNSSVTVKVGALNSSVLLLKIAQDSYVLQFSLINSRGKYELLRVELNFTLKIHLKLRFLRLGSKKGRIFLFQGKYYVKIPL